MIQVIRPNAKDDILRQFRYYLLKEAFDTADSFLAAVDESISTICTMPEMGAPRQFKNPMLAGLRFHPVKGFEDILIFYVAHPDALRIVRVLHGKRDLKKILELEHEDQMPN